MTSESTGMDAFSWPLSSITEAVEHLARRAGLRPAAVEAAAPFEQFASLTKADFRRFVAWSGERLGVEAESVSVTLASVEAILLNGGPAVLHYQDKSEMRLLLLVGSRFGKARFLCPDLRVRSCSLSRVRDVICEPHEKALLPEINSLLEIAQVSSRRQHRVRALIARERLGEQAIATAWMLRLPPTANFMSQLRDIGLVRRVALMVGISSLLYGLELLGWAVIGAAALNGRLDFGWLTAWVLLVLSVIPLQVLVAWIDSNLALDVSRLIKTRLLLGALQFDVEAMRRHGVGQLLGRVIESQAFEALALNSGLTAVVSIVQLVFAAWVLSRGAGGLLHVGLLVLWVGVAVALSRKYFHRLGDWTARRLGLTQSLVERMVGHQTTLAQESPDRRDHEQDSDVTQYLNSSTRLDNMATPFMAGVPSGWMMLGLVGLIPPFISGSSTPTTMAIGLGGVLLAGRAFDGLAGGLSAAAGAAVAWKQIGPLFLAGRRDAATSPFVSTADMRVGSDATRALPLVDADNLTFRYASREDPVLKQVSLTIRHGDRVLLEGGSGGGKSTFASMLAGLRTPDSGLLRLNGLDRFTIGDSWHRFATEAPQFHENHLLSSTLGFNLLMGKNWPASDTELAEAEEVCEELGLGPLLRSMPAGLMQNVGETGWQLSHGERSRVFLARALLQHAELTVLDESFAALDPESLETCLSAVLRRSQTLVVVAHP